MSLAKLITQHRLLVVKETLKKNDGNRKLAALALGITPRALKKILGKHGLSKPRYAKPLPFSSGELVTAERRKK